MQTLEINTEVKENSTLIKNYIKSQSYQKEFKDLMLLMLDKYGVEIFNLCGIGEQLDLNKAVKKMVKADNTANGSIDSNANVGATTSITIMHEISKPHILMQSYYRLWKWLKKNRSLEVANKFVKSQLLGEFYVNDMHYNTYIQPYCFNHSCLYIATQGLVGVNSKNNITPPKYLRSFFDIMEAYLLISGASTAGATGISNLLVVASVFLKKMINNNFTDSHVCLKSEEDCWTYFKEELTSFIYKLNQDCRGNQSLFTNVSIYDKNFLNTIIPETILFIDGNIYDTDLETVQRVQEIYLDVMNEEAERVVHTFPVTTACFASKYNEETGKNEILDQDFLDFICRKNEKNGFINMYSGDTATLSSCCFDGKQKVLVKDSKNGVRLLSLEELFNMPYIEKPNLTVFNNGFWSKTRAIKVPRFDKKMYTIETVKHQKFNCTEDHILITDRGEIQAKDLTENDYLMVNNLTLPKINERDQKLTYEQGVLVGAYLGDGSIYRRKENNGCETTFSLNENKIENLQNLLTNAIKQLGAKNEIRVNNSKNNVVFLKINGTEVADFIESWCICGHAENKSLNLNALAQSEEFRRGILDGLHMTDGHSLYNILYTSSKKLAETIECLVTTLGGICNISTDDRTDEKVIIRNKEYQRNNAVYHIRFLFNRKKQVENVLKVEKSRMYVKISSITETEYNDNFVYCLEMHNEEDHYFTLPNGIHLSNCRLRSDKNNAFFNSFGGASDSIGSMGVVCINLPQLAFKYKNNAGLFKRDLKDIVNLAQEVNYAKRCLLKHSIKKGHLPLYTNGYMDLSKQFSTLGFIGLYEACEIYGKDITTPEGLAFAQEILHIMEETNEKFSEEHKIPCNMEGIPGENTCVKLALKDRVLGFNDKYNMYSNQFIPLSKRCNLLDRIKLSSAMDKYCSGGSIMHITVDSQMSLETMKDIVSSIIESGVKYFAFNYEINQCKDCGKIFVGKTNTCISCGGDNIDRYMRVVGFLTKKSSWSETRQSEDRQYYNF